MAQVIQPGDLGQDQTLNQPGSQNQAQSGNQAGQAPPTQSQGASTPSGGPVNPNKQQGSGFTNIQKVIQANQGNQLGSAVGNNLQQVQSTAQQNLQNAQNQFNQQTQANQANTQANQQLAQNVLNDPTQYVNQSSNPGNAQAGSQFQSLLSGQYQGPQALANASQLQNQAANVAQQGQALGSSAGRIGLLQQMVANPQYGAGAANLDSLLLGQSNDPSLQAARRGALTLQGQVSSAVQGAAAQGQEQAAQAQQFGQALQNQLGQNVTQQNAQIQQQATSDQQARNAQYQKALGDLQSGNVTQDEANVLGLTQGENLYGVDASKFLTENPLQANASNDATAQQYAQMQALQQLAGQYAPQSAQQAFQNYQNPSLAGQFGQSQALVGDQSGLQSAVQGTQSNFQQQLAALQAQLPGMQNIGAIGNQNNGVLPGAAAAGAAGAKAGSFLPGVGSVLGGAIGAAGSLFNSGNQTNAESQQRETAKQQESASLQDYLSKVNALANQFGMNTGQFANMTDAQKAAQFDPNNVGAGTNYQNIINAINNSLTANNNGINIQPAAAAPQSSFPTLSTVPGNLEQFPTVT